MGDVKVLWARSNICHPDIPIVFTSFLEAACSGPENWTYWCEGARGQVALAWTEAFLPLKRAAAIAKWILDHVRLLEPGRPGTDRSLFFL